MLGKDQSRWQERWLWLLVLVGALRLGVGYTYAQEARGQLPNGLSYIIRHNAEPRQKAECWLVLRLGSGVQEPGEEGVAHFLEHLAFAGSQHFPGQGITRYAERLGVRYGIGLNALTGHDRTVYMMSLPLDGQGVLDTAMLIVGDWLTGLRLDSLAMERERSVIREEIRAYEPPDPFYSLKIGRGAYGRSLPIGTPEDIDRVRIGTLRRFYERWYSPSLATVLIVGDVDPQRTESLLRRTLSTLPARPAPPMEGEELTYDPEYTHSVLPDTLLSTATLDLIFPHRTPPTRTEEELLQSLTQRMALRAWAHRTDLIPGMKLTDHWYLGRTSHLALTLEGGQTQGLLRDLRHALSALSALQRPGTITPRELVELKARAKASLFALGEATPSASWCDYYVDEILHGDLFLKTDQEVQSLARRIDAVRVEDLQPYLAEYQRLVQGNALVAYSYNPRLGGQTPPTTTSLKQALQAGLQTRRTLLRYTPEEEVQPTKKLQPIPAVLTAGRTPRVHILSRRTYEGIGVTEAFLSNGIRLLLRPLAGADSLVRIAINQPRGLRAVPDSLQCQVSSLAAYMELGGIEAIPCRDSLMGYMYDHGVSMTLTEAMDWGALLGTAPTAETYPLLRLMREKMLRPERAYEDFEEIRQGQLGELGRPSRLGQMLHRQPDRRILRLIDSVLGTYIPQREPESRQEIQSLSLDRMVAYHRDQWSRTEGLTIVVVGRFDLEEMLHEISDVFAGLPRRPLRPLPRERALSPRPETVITLEADQTDQTLLHNIYYGSYTPGLRTALQLRILRELLRNRLIARLRSEAGIIYSPYLYMDYRPEPRPFVSLRLETLVQPENAPLACRLIEELVEELRTKPAGEQEIADIRRTFVVNKREALTESNSSEWQTLLLSLVRNGEQLQDFQSYEEILRSITPEELRQTIHEVLDPSRHLIYSIVPQVHH